MTLKDFKDKFSDWNTYYKDNEVEEMAWYEKNLDHDLEKEIVSGNLRGKECFWILEQVLEHRHFS